MKKYLVSALVGVLSWNAQAQTADQDVTNGLAFLASHDLAGANQQFAAALALSPANQSANALVAITRLLLLPTTPAGSNFLNALGYAKAGRDIYDWTSKLPLDAYGDQSLPTNNTSVMVAFYRTNIMAALAASRTNLAQITDPNFTLSLTADETSLDAVTVDYGDILLLQALERMAEFAGYTAGAQNDSVVLSQLQALGKTNGLSIQKLLSLYPSFLTLANTNDLAASKAALTNAITLYFAASDFIRNVRAPSASALFVLSDDETNAEALFRTGLTNFLASLNGPATFDAPDPVTIDSSVYFSGAKTVRSLLPQFNGNSYVLNTLPDYTFGGILPNEPAYLIEKTLRKLLPAPGGIFLGHVQDWTVGSGDDGIFAVFENTNRQAVVAGFDVPSFGSFTGAQSGGIGAQFPVDSSGNWQFNSNKLAGVSGHGSFDKDGTFEGELDFTNKDSVWLQGQAQSVLQKWNSDCFQCHGSELTDQSFRGVAGSYSGTWTLNGSTGKLQAVLSDAGFVAFCVYSPAGAQTDGGLAQLAVNNTFWTDNTASGTVVAGTLNPATFQITGAITNGSSHGTFTLTRNAALQFDTPPVITKNLPAALSATLGTNLIISLTATGSPPMCYQWYSNSVAIPRATASALVLSNLQFSGAAVYSVVIDNVAGETNSVAAALSVVPETVRPTNQITAPVNGQQVSNALCTVTGKAGDNVAVANVLVQANNGGWNPATPSPQWANWSAQVPLIPGSNTVQAYAVDTSGNYSLTNSVLFKYVVSAPLIVEMAGRGIISPNDSNALLQIGAAYAITASTVTNSGFVFSNWTGGTSLPLAWLTNGATVKFIMSSNLILQANFTDTNRPALAITNATSGMLLSNASFLVKGTATDNVAVAQVSCRLNGAAWSNATSFAGASWSDAVVLLPGTNQFQACAADASGNVSATNTVNLVYVVSAPLKVSTNGLGTLTPNDNGLLLQIGKAYAITAAPAAGFRFTNWLAGTNLPLTVATNGTTVQFIMVTNLMLQANFVDTNRPSLAITAPSAGQHMSNALAFVAGTASDNWKVTGVWCQLNSNEWYLATSTNGWTNWATICKLIAGTNTIRAYAADLGGNFSPTNSVSVLSSNTFKLWLGMSNALSGKGMDFNLTLSTGLTGHIEFSTNLATWLALTNFVGSNGAVGFRDPAATNGARYYRAVIP